MSLKLYEITEEMEALDGLVDSWAAHHEGDITDFPLSEELERLEGEREEKLLNLAVWVKNLEAEAEAFSPEIKRLQARQRALKNKAASIKSFIDYNLEEREKLSDTRAAMSYRESSQVVIDVLTEDLPAEMVKVTVAPDKTLIKAAVKAGDCDYAHIEKFNNLQIK